MIVQVGIIDINQKVMEPSVCEIEEVAPLQMYRVIKERVGCYLAQNGA